MPLSFCSFAFNEIREQKLNTNILENFKKRPAHYTYYHQNSDIQPIAPMSILNEEFHFF
jgi:hypothetical protein